MEKIKLAEYIWLDGTKPTSQIRSKSRVVSLLDSPNLNSPDLDSPDLDSPDSDSLNLDDFPEWSFDGSSTNQAVGEDSDCILKPVNFVKDPLSETDGYLVLCEVFNPDGSVHSSNSRAILRKALENGGADEDVWLGFEQEYTMFKKNIPLGWPEHGFPGIQGPYYCGVGSEQIFGRDLARRHQTACIEAGIMYYGSNAEVMPGQWEYQIGYRGIDSEDAGALNISDHTWIARWLMHRLSEEYNIHISHENKPIKGDWNGAGMHANFSTKNMRDPQKGRATIKNALIQLESTHQEHIKHYGERLEERLTGKHETSSISTFSAGNANRGSSIRIPRPVADKGYGYIEDRRPGANADPYMVAALLISTICSVSK
ncbi:MAG: glutamine synthetase [Rickettsiales bacterium]|nr:MAG: glutamine synthetase [Rickettsiales bacterium]